MKLINKKNSFSIICITYTVVSLTLTIYEIIRNQAINPTQLNIILFLILSVLGVCVLSQQYRLDRFSPLSVLIILYGIAIVIILIALRAASNFVELHPDGYRDVIVSFSVPYGIGMIIYYICLRLEVKKQNKLLENIKSIDKKVVTHRK